MFSLSSIQFNSFREKVPHFHIPLVHFDNCKLTFCALAEDKARRRGRSRIFILIMCVFPENDSGSFEMDR